MSNSYTLEDLQADLDKEFSPVKLTAGGREFKLRNLMRLSDAERESVFRALEVVSTDTEDESETLDSEAMAAMSDAVWTMLRALPADGRGEELVELIGGDLALGMKVVSIYTEATQPGEATDSPS